MKVRVTSPKLYSTTGQIPIGTVVEIAGTEVPAAWKAHCVVVASDDELEPVLATPPAEPAPAAPPAPKPAPSVPLAGNGETFTLPVDYSTADRDVLLAYAEANELEFKPQWGAEKLRIAVMADIKAKAAT